jgi:hypothetical protein
MTVVWIALWVALSVFIIGVFVWTTQALQLQKAAWKKFAAAHGLAFLPGRFFQAGTVRGMLDDIEVLLTSEERNAPDLRGRKYVTLLQLGLPYRLPAPAALGTGDYRAFVAALDAREPLVLDFPGWAAGQVVAKTDDRARVDPYLTPERLRALDGVIKQKGLSVLYLFDERNTYLRLETSDPMLRPGQLDKLIEGLRPVIKVLAPS